MTITRKFLDWKHSAIESAAQHLLERFGTNDRWDLDQVIVVVQGSRAAVACWSI